VVDKNKEYKLHVHFTKMLIYICTGRHRTSTRGRPTECIINVRAFMWQTKVVKIHLRKIRRTRLEKICSPGIPGHDLQDSSITTLSPRDRKPIRQSYKYCAQVKERYVFHPPTKSHLESLTYLSVGVPSQVSSPDRRRHQEGTTEEEEDRYVSNYTTTSIDRA